MSERDHAIERAIARRGARAYTRTMFSLFQGEDSMSTKQPASAANATPETAETKSADATKPKHKATYATDKRSGGYMIRVSGPYPEKFAGREVPVTTRSGAVHNEKLVRLVWTGKDEESGEPVALYKFESKPRDEQELPF